jgi:formylglycine-generating enzyme required for sulfatase activity
VGRLSPGDEIEVTGKVAGKNWYRIAMEGGKKAFVFASLLTERKPAEKQVAVGVYPKAGREPGETFKDCAECPEMVVIPAGRFRMGDLSGSGDDDEKPVHAVTIGYKFAVGKFEVTFDEWDACVAEGSCFGRRPDDEDWGRGRRPAINVSWEDAKNYVHWLSFETGQVYRLLSEAEWEYVARAGTTTAYNTGSGISKGQARYQSRGTVRVGSYSPNAFGLYDVHGNVFEWAEDCWHDSYHGAPGDGGAWTTGGDCDERVLRGGSWSNRPRNLRSADRARDTWVIRDSLDGFRVARTF